MRLSPDRPLRLDAARRVLLVKPSALGDVVHALPVLATLHARYPNIAFDWLVEEEAAGIVLGHPALADAVVSGRRRWLRMLRTGEAGAAVKEARGFMARLRSRRYDAVCDLQGLLKSALYAVSTGAPVRVGLRDAREGARFAMTHVVSTPPQPVHAVDRYLALAAALDAPDRRRDFTIAVDAGAESRAETLLRGLPAIRVAVHPFARWDTKLWEADRWRAVTATFASRGYGVVVTGGAGEADAAAVLAQGLPAVRSLAGQLSIKELAAVLARVALLVTLDSGPMHVAGAMGTPVVAMFGPTDPKRTGPIGPATVIRRPLACSPCLSRRCQIPETRRCMRDIGVAEIVAAARDWVEGEKSQGVPCAGS
jgi:lipopolysaccharide heptosyltransferase I